jgi:large subunit ribosomal protein L18
MNKTKNLNKRKAQRIGRVRAIIKGTAERPRLVVNRTNQHIYAQLIDDVKGVTLLSAKTGVSKAGSAIKTNLVATAATGKKSDQALALGESLGKKAVEKGITVVVFDRRSYQFHGRVKSFAEGAKKGGLKI